MKSRSLRTAGFLLSLAISPGLVAYAQHPGTPPVGPPPGLPGGPGVPVVPKPAIVAPKLSTSTSASAQFGPAGRWWDDKSVVQTVGLNNEQKRKMDAIFHANEPAILAAYKNFLEQQSKLAAINKDPKASKEQTFAAIDAVSQARADLQKAAAQMYLQIREEMTPEQVEKLQKLQ